MRMTAVLEIQNLVDWELCPVFLPFSPHTIAPVVPAYLGILIPFIIFDLIFFMYVHSLLMDNAESDVKVSEMKRLNSNSDYEMSMPPYPSRGSYTSDLD